MIEFCNVIMLGIDLLLDEMYIYDDCLLIVLQDRSTDLYFLSSKKF